MTPQSSKGTTQPSKGGNDSSAVRLHGIRKRFGYRETLRGIDLDLPRESCTAILGANGAGKSTLLRVVATHWRPSHGTGEVFGWDLLRDARQIRGRVGVVFHEHFLRPELSLEENLRYAGDLFGASPCERWDALIDRLGLGPRRRDRVGTFSQGMAKRASIVRSLLHAPDLWILDEPFSGLDPEGRRLLFDMVRDYNRGGGTVLLVTHQVDLGRELATTILELDDGVFREADTPAEGGRR